MLSLSASLLLLFSSVQATGDFACEESPTERADAGPPGVCTDGPSVLSVAFGSCHHQGQPSPTLLAAAASEPDVFVWMGDNLYNDLDPWGVPCEPIDCGRRSRALTSPILIGLFGLLPVWLKRAVFQHAIASRDDEAAPSVSDDTAGLPANYAALAAKPEFQYLRERVPLMFATWDDHDFGRNDAGGDYAHAALSRELFLRFWRGGEGAVEARVGRGGVYESHLLGSGARTAQLILLDTRSFRDQMLRESLVAEAQRDAQCATPDGDESLGEYCAHADNASATLLGEEQWQWLEAELRMPGPAVRLIGSSIAFASEFHGMEGWSLFPAEQRRLVEVLRRTRAEGVIFITGDVHFAELSRIHPTGLYPLYDLASSGLNMDWPVAPHNSRRLAGPVHRYNWGCVVIDWTRQSLELEIRDASGALALQRTVLLDELRIPAAHSDS